MDINASLTNISSLSQGNSSFGNTPVGNSAFDIAHFRAEMESQPRPPVSNDQQAQTVQDTAAPSGSNAAIDFLNSLNGASDLIGSEVLKVASPHTELTPGEMLNITVKTHAFLFQSEMTANMANRTSDGIQQLFKQQS